MEDHVHVFVGEFVTRDDACQYTEAQWEPEPDEDVSDEEYEAWEERNPQWQMRTDLGEPYLDSDFIETIDGVDRFNYLAGLITETGAVEAIRAKALPSDNILVLIFTKALGGFAAEMQSTPRLKYCGKFPCKI